MTGTSRSLLALLHELSDCLATALSEDAITQQSAEVESVALRMRKVLLSLLGDCIQVQTVKENDLLTVMKLIGLALDRYPSMFSCSHCSTAVIMILHILRFCTEPRLRSAQIPILNSIKGLLTLIFRRCKDRWNQLLDGALDCLTDLHEVMKLLTNPAISLEGLDVAMSCFHTVQQATVQEMKVDVTGRAEGAVLALGSGLTEEALHISLSSPAQCHLLTSAVVAMLSHLISISPSSSICHVSALTVSHLLDFIGCGDTGLQARSLDCVALLLDSPSMGALIPVDDVIACLLVAIQTTDVHRSGDFTQRSSWEASFMRVLRQLIKTLGTAPVPGLSNLAVAVGDMAAAAPPASHIQAQLYMAYADLLCACSPAVQQPIQQLLSMAKLLAAHPSLSRVLSHTLLACARPKGPSLGSANQSGEDLGSEPRTGSQAVVGGRLRPRGTSWTTAPAAKRRRLTDATVASRDSSACDGTGLPVRHPDGVMAAPSLQAVSAAAVCMQSFDDLACALAPDGQREWSSEERLLALDVLLLAGMPSSPEACNIVWQNVQGWGVWALTRPPETPSCIREAGLVLGIFGAIFANSILGSQGNPAGSCLTQFTAPFGPIATQLTMTKEQLRLLSILPWSRSMAASVPSAASQATPAQCNDLVVGKIRGMQMQIALVAKGLLENESKAGLFTHGTPVSLGSKDAEPRVRAGAAWISAGLVVLVSKQKKDFKAGTACMARLLSDKNEHVKKAAIGGLIFALTGTHPTQAVAHTCWAAETQLSQVFMRQHWAPCRFERQQPGIGESLSSVYVQQVLSSISDDGNVAPELLALPVHICVRWLEHASPEALQTAEGKQLARNFVNFAHEGSCPVVEALADKVDGLARPGVLSAAFSSDSGVKDGEGKLEQLQVHLMQDLKGLLEGSDGGHLQDSLLRLIAATSTVLPHADLVLMVVLVTRLECADPVSRAVAAELLQGVATARGVGLHELVLDCSFVLEFCGRSTVRLPQLLGEVADVLEMDEHLLCERVLKESLAHLILAEDREAMQIFSERLGTPLHQLVKEYAPDALARCIYHGTSPECFQAFTVFMESLIREDLVHFLSLPHVLKDVVAAILDIAGSVADWGDTYEMPAVVYKRVREVLQTLRDVSGSKAADLADFLIGSDVTGILKGYGDALEKAQPVGAYASDVYTARHSPRVKQSVVLRSTLLLIKLTGKHLGMFWPQLMALLTQSVRPHMPLETRLQALEVWLTFVEGLATEAPAQLTAVVDQVVVALLEVLQEGGALTAATGKVVDALIVKHQTLLGDRLRSLPPLPDGIEVLHRVYSVLKKERGTLTLEQQCSLLLDSLANPSLSVRATTLLELRNFLHKHRKWLGGTLSGTASVSGDSGQSHAGILNKILSSLLKCCDPEMHTPLSRRANLACAECLGVLGALDPARVTIDLHQGQGMLRDEPELVITLMKQHLVRLLRVAPSLQILDGTTFAIQEVLEKYQGMEPPVKPKGPVVLDSATGMPENGLFAALPDDLQVLVRPYLHSKYALQGAMAAHAPRVVFSSLQRMSFRSWLTTWVKELVDHQVLGSRMPLYRACNLLFRRDLQFSRFLLPYIVQDVIAFGSDLGRSLVKQEILAVLQDGHRSREGELCVQAVFTLLDDMQVSAKETRSLSSGGASAVTAGTPTFDMPTTQIVSLLESIPQDVVAKAAQQCGAHARALLYFETYVRALRGGGRNPAAYKSAQYADEEVTFLQEIYGKLEEPDGLAGVIRLRTGGARLQDQLLAADKAGQWSEALALYEQELQDATPGTQFCLKPAHLGHLRCLLHMGHIKNMLAEVDGWAGQCSGAEHQEISSWGVAGAWRIGDWGLLEKYLKNAKSGQRRGKDSEDQWEVCIGSLIAAVHDRQWDTMRTELERARVEIMASLSAASMDSYSRAYPHLVRLHMLQELQDSALMLERGSLSGPIERRSLLQWDKRLEITQPSLIFQEPILALRRQLASLSGAHSEAGQYWLQQARISRASGHYDAARTATNGALSSKVPGAALENARLLWEVEQSGRRDRQRAIVVLQEVIEHEEALHGGRCTQFSSEQKQSHAEVVLQMARWMGMSGKGLKAEITGLYKRAINLASKSEKVYFYFAKYLDRLMMNARQRQETARTEKSGGDRLQGKARIVLGEDQPFLEIIPELISAYGSAMEYGHQYIYQAMPRMLTIWFDFGSYCLAVKAKTNKEKTTRATIIMTMQKLMKDLPSYTWLVALPQLASRICHPNNETSALTQHLLTRLTAAYPHQVLWALAAVSKSTVQARQEAASRVISSARQHCSDEHRELFKQFTSLCDQLIRICHFQPPPKARTFSARRDFASLSRMMPLKVMVPISACFGLALPSTGLPDKSYNPYGEIVTISGIKDEVEVLSSLQKPKKIILVGSDGKEYPFLAKPKDDLRKDSRMMEVAGLLNRLFLKEPSSRRRNLYIRRFCVQPLTEDCGIVEWVAETTGLRHCCQDTYVAQGLFDKRTTNPQIKKMYEQWPANKKMSDLLENVLKLFPPVLHLWFLGQYSEPVKWHNARLAFTRTTAVWSMVGHIVGLGDRHGENILVDASSGDIVHVDFSCLFDKGLTLAKPEMVPFRLTQNLIDGFGVAGVEGTFRHVCEITLQVLRDHRETLMSVMETFVHDPLVEWTNGHRSGDELDNPHAKDALATIDGRLTGTLLGVRSTSEQEVSAEVQAHCLIEEAVDKENLGQMYIWWMPWF